MKCSVKRGWRTNHRWIAGVLWVEELSRMRCTSRCVGTDLSNAVQKATELLGPLSGGEVGHHVARGDVQGSIEVRGAVALVVVGGPLGDPGHQRKHRRAAVQGLDLALHVYA